MREVEAGGIFAGIAGQDQVEVKSAGGPWEGPFTAVRLLDGQERIEKLAGSERRLADRDGIQVKRLIVEPVAFGLCLDRLRNDEVGDDLGQALDGKVEGRTAVSQVGAQGNRNRGQRPVSARST